MYLNKFIGCGNSAADPDVREAGGKKAASFRIGISEKYKDSEKHFQERTEWINIIAWGKTAEVAEKYITKGTPVLVEGKLRNRQWIDQSGNKRYVCEVEANTIQVDRKRMTEGQPQRASQAEEYDEDLGF